MLGLRHSPEEILKLKEEYAEARKNPKLRLSPEEVLKIKKDYAEARKNPEYRLFSKEEIESNVYFQKIQSQTKKFLENFDNDWLKRKAKLITCVYDNKNSLLSAD